MYYTKNFTGLLPTDTYRYAAIARNILNGEGFVESQIWPVRFVYDSEPPFYVNRIPPAQPFFIAASFKLFGFSETSPAKDEPKLAAKLESPGIKEQRKDTERPEKRQVERVIVFYTDKTFREYQNE